MLQKLYHAWIYWLFSYCQNAKLSETEVKDVKAMLNKTSKGGFLLVIPRKTLILA